MKHYKLVNHERTKDSQAAQFDAVPLVKKYLFARFSRLYLTAGNVLTIWEHVVPRCFVIAHWYVHAFIYLKVKYHLLIGKYPDYLNEHTRIFTCTVIYFWKSCLHSS